MYAIKWLLNIECGSQACKTSCTLKYLLFVMKHSKEGAFGVKVQDNYVAHFFRYKHVYLPQKTHQSNLMFAC